MPQESNIFRNLLADGDRLIEEELMFKSPRIKKVELLLLNFVKKLTILQ